MAASTGGSAKPTNELPVLRRQLNEVEDTMVTASKSQRRRQIQATIRTATKNAEAWEAAGFLNAAATAYASAEYWQEQLVGLTATGGGQDG